MGTHILDKIFNPRGVAVFGATEREGAVGQTILANLLTAGYEGTLVPVNPKHDTVQGLPCVPELRPGEHRVDLALIATPARAVPAILRNCGEAGLRGAVILSAGFGEAGREGQRLQQECVEIAQRYRMRLIGPNCLGIMRPRIGLNATFSHNQALPGKLGLVSSSGALVTAVLDWAQSTGIGFSGVASTGDAADVDFGELLDYLAVDPETQGILLYVEGIRHTRRFLSGLRAAARMKPVVVLKSARHAATAQAAATHTGAMMGSDAVFDAALERAGVVRVERVSQWFSAAHILAQGMRLRGENLAILTNGGGPGVMAVDRAADLGLELASLADKSMDALNDLLPGHWSHGNPIDILGDATAERYGEALRITLADPGVDMAVVLLTPQAMTDPDACAEAVIEQARNSRKPVLACWMGDPLVASARRRFDEAGIPQYRTPEAAIETFAWLIEHRRNQRMLLQTPGPLCDETPSDIEGAHLILQNARNDGRKVLSIRESKAVLAAFHIPTNPSILARDPADAMLAAETLGFPVALKISATGISHKSDFGGVRLNLRSVQTVRQQTQEMLDQIREHFPDADVEGVTVERMSEVGHARELLLGISRDPVFGPVIAFGLGGTAVEVIGDQAIALPPLNRSLAERLVDQTRAARTLGEFRGAPPVPREAIEQVLLRVSEMACELPELASLDINPLQAGEHGVMAVDARIELADPGHDTRHYAHMAIHPYPGHVAHTVTTRDGHELELRPIRPEDAAIEQAFVRSLSEKTRYLRFMRSLDELTPEMLVRFTQIDYDREMAFIAVDHADGQEVQVGVARYTTEPDGESAEFAVVVSDAWQGRGVGSLLMEAIVDSARRNGLRELFGEVLRHNDGMLALARRHGFQREILTSDDEIIRVSRRLH
ncbi:MULTISPECIES: bifunctional acetate--CoA ligase family protein/GNAT family N-acetyltransferase [unclassified Thioalkalivibrio]|uniref:bifunctional acetate--CoA ligase family protein/GNAT family N-acetyltransferase n=1 Tax=unclassified Thioalkalivibrio TaxID=2621013 RepID=UPI00036E952E|nr:MULTISPECIES: bifunctional acetate--CoA ligase family protein/GNAT family N-acetyltransferase [unclassified Thioalkalivibrio]